jgi:hypothetical protein
LMQGIRQARVAELKTMLNSIPIPPPVSAPTSLLIKAGTWTIISGLVVTGAYYYFTNDSSKTGNESTAKVESKTLETTPTVAEPVEKPTTEIELKDKPVESVKPSNIKSDKREVVSSPVKPDLKVYDPSKENVNEEEDADVRKYEQEQLALISRAFVTSSIEVETENTNRKYTFHYMFNDGKLMLYGAFEKNLYEILEFISDDKRTVVLFYKTNYYLLDIRKSTPTVLTPIRDRGLLKKLSEYRGH